MVEITADIQKIIDVSKTIPEVVSLQVTEVPQHLIDQIGNSDATYFDYIIKTEDGEEVELAFVVLNSSIDADSHANLAIKDLISCSCVKIEDESLIGLDAHYCVSNNFLNKGKTVYYIRPDDHYLVRLTDTYATILNPTPIQKILIDTLKYQPGVIDIHLEEIVDDSIKSSVIGANPVMLVCTINKNGHTGQIHFALPEILHNNSESFNYVKDNLLKLLSQ
jgi:hypothetical protein